MLKIVTWNVNGLRSCLGKGFLEYFEEADADLFCLQECIRRKRKNISGTNPVCTKNC